jgi:hypothetical protein
MHSTKFKAIRTDDVLESKHSKGVRSRWVWRIGRVGIGIATKIDWILITFEPAKPLNYCSSYAADGSVKIAA